MNKSFNLLSLAALALSGFGVTSAMAQNPNYAPGDVVLFFQQFGGSNTIMANIGSGTTFRDATSNMVNITNIGGLLSNASTGFGANWFETSGLYWGAAGVRSTSTSTTAAAVNGDPNRTLYVSAGRLALGIEGTAGSGAWSLGANADMTTGASNIFTMNNRLETVSAISSLVEGTASSTIDEQNPFLGSNPGTAFGVFPGGVEGGFGAGSLGSFGGVSGVEGALDLYRILATTTASGTIAIGDNSDLRNGTYEGSFVIDNTGSVSYIVAAAAPEPTSAMLLGMTALIGGCVRRRKATV
ncbi:MAG: hypothetical protein K8R23_12275 [Chthoniobacter sp.]|nr:hypothetical protein [Chthoniobacter sp.]